MSHRSLEPQYMHANMQADEAIDSLDTCPNELYKRSVLFPPYAYPHLVDRGFKVFHVLEEDTYHIVPGDPHGHLDIFSDWNDENCVVVVAHSLKEEDIHPDNWYPADLEDLLHTMIDIQELFGIYETSHERAARSESIRVLHSAAVLSAQRNQEKRVPARFIDLVLPRCLTARDISASERKRTLGQGEVASDTIPLCVMGVLYDVRMNHPLTEEDVVELGPEVPLDNLMGLVLHIYFEIKHRSNDLPDAESSPPQAARYETVRVLRKELNKREETDIEDFYKPKDPAEQEEIELELRSMPRRRDGSPSDVHRPSADAGASGTERADRHARPWHWQNKRTNGGQLECDDRHGRTVDPKPATLQHRHGVKNRWAEPFTSDASLTEAKGCSCRCQPAELRCAPSPIATTTLSAGHRTPDSSIVEGVQIGSTSGQSVQQQVAADPPAESRASAKGKERAVPMAGLGTPYTFLF